MYKYHMVIFQFIVKPKPIFNQDVASDEVIVKS